MDSDGETALIPTEIMKFCIEESEKGKINDDFSLKLLASPSQSVDAFPGIEEFADPLVRLIAAVFRLCEVEKSAAEARMQYSLSPEVGSTVIWFLSRFSVSYLFPNEDHYFKVSSYFTCIVFYVNVTIKNIPIPSKLKMLGQFRRTNLPGIVLISLVNMARNMTHFKSFQQCDLIYLNVVGAIRHVSTEKLVEAFPSCKFVFLLPVFIFSIHS